MINQAFEEKTQSSPDELTKQLSSRGKNGLDRSAFASRGDQSQSSQMLKGHCVTVWHWMDKYGISIEDLGKQWK
jgi:hypothetical protein